MIILAIARQESRQNRSRKKTKVINELEVQVIERTEEYVQTITSVEDMPAVARDIVSMYCRENDIDEKDIFPSIWNDIIDELYIKLFKPCNRVLKTDSNKYNEYDKDKVLYIYNNIYRRLCNNHCQEVSQKGFIDMIGIDKQTLYNWASSASFDLQQKIQDDNEQSLFALMKDRRMNPMKVLPKLNRYHGWNMPGARGEPEKRKVLTAAELPKLGGGEVKGIDVVADGE